MDPLRILILVVWGGGTVLVYARALMKRLRSYRIHHDRRSRRDLMVGFALFLTAMCSALAIAFVLFGQQGTGIRGFFVSISLGAFLAAGWVMAGEDASQEASDSIANGNQ